MTDRVTIEGMEVAKYTGLARKWNRGLLGGLESTPKEVLQNFLGSTTFCGGSNPLTSPIKYSLMIEILWRLVGV